MAVRREYIADLYRNLLGRGDNYSEDEVSGWENAPDEQSVYNAFIGSPEYTSAHGGEAKWNDVNGVITPVDEPKYIPPPDYGPQGGGNVQPADYGGGYFNSSSGGGANDSTFNPTTGDWRKLQGFNSENYYNPDMNSVKYTFARLANEYDPTPEGLKRLVNDPRFKAAFPNAKLVDVDKIDFGGAPADGKTGAPVGVIDVGGGFDAKTNTGRNWWWGYEPGPIGGGAAAPTSSSGGGLPRSTTSSPDTRSMYQSSGQYYGGPGSPGIFNGPVQQVGQDPLSFLITGGLGDFLERGGTTPFGQQVRESVLSRLDGNNPNIARRFESARELMDKGKRTMMNDTRAALANRGLLSEPGIPQGAEIGAVKRTEEAIAPEFSRALRDIYTDETTQALSMATGMASDEAKNFLAGIGEGTQRQTALANIALQSLGQNMAWNQFLAEFGLKRDQVLNEMQNGRVDDVMALLNSFLSLSSLSRGGYIGS
jgi:hypothetical protein